jgi:hypothetical protein
VDKKYRDEYAELLKRLNHTSNHEASAPLVDWRDAELDRLRRELAEADALIAKGLAVVHDFLPNIGRCVLQDYQRMNEFCSEAAARAAVSAVQPERCCVDYPRCDCNSPAEWPTREEAEKRAAELMAIGRATLSRSKHTPECSYWDGLMAQVCNCGAADAPPSACNHFPGQVNCEWCTEPERATQPVEPKP